MKLGPLEITWKSTGRFSCTLDPLVRHPAYVLSIILLIMPINGFLIASGSYILGACLILSQAEWAYGLARDASKNRDA